MPKPQKYAAVLLGYNFVGERGARMVSVYTVDGLEIDCFTNNEPIRDRQHFTSECRDYMSGKEEWEFSTLTEIASNNEKISNTRDIMDLLQSNPW